MLNIEKYKEELENIGVLNPDKLAAQKAVALIEQIIGYFQNTKSQKLIGARLRLILRFWLEMMKVENGLKDILLDLNTENSMRG